MALDYEQVDMFQHTIDQIAEAVDTLNDLKRSIDDPVTKERLNQCIANIETATHQEHMWVGGSMFNLEQVILEIQGIEC